MSEIIEKKESVFDWRQIALTFFGQVLGWIAAPVIIAIYLGQWLDKVYNSGTFYFYLCVAIAFVLTNVGLLLNVVKYSKIINRELLAEKNSKNK